MQYLAKNHILSKSGIDFNFGGDWTTLHSHDYWEFILITEGCSQIINNHKVTLNKGYALIVRPNDSHKFIDSKAAISQFNIKTTNDLLLNLLNGYAPELFPFLIERREPIILNLSSFEYNAIYKNVQATIFDNNKDRSALYLRTAVHVILNNFIDSIYIPLNSTKRYSIIVQQIIEKISMWSNFSQPLSELLSEFNFSYMQLYRIFKKETGCSLNDYFLYSKMLYASTLLLTSPDTIISIAQAIGYATQSHFGKAFKDFFGVTPTEYRKNNIPLQPLQSKTIPIPLNLDIEKTI